MTRCAATSKKIDEVETRIGAHKRMIEGYEAAVAKIDIERAAIQKELDVLNKAVKDQERQQAFNAWTVEYERTAQNAITAIDSARVALARLALIGRRSEEFDRIGNFVGSLHRDRILGDFFAQIPPGSRGFERVHGPRINEMEFLIWPSARKEELR